MEKAQSLIFRFGYDELDGEIESGKTYRAIADNPVLNSDNELDYALIEVLIDSENPLPEPLKPSLSHTPIPGNQINLIHHPAGWAQHWDQGTITLNANDEGKFEHNANAQGGSSGGAILDINWNLIALHCSGSTSFNLCVPISAIMAHINRKK